MLAAIIIFAMMKLLKCRRFMIRFIIGRQKSRQGDKQDRSYTKE